MASTQFKRIFRSLAGYALKGLVVSVPLVATVYIIYVAFVTIDDLLPFDIPGLGILALIISVTVLGFLASSFIAEPIMAYFSRLLNRAPLIKTIYSSIRDLLSAFVGQKKSFSEAVLVKVNDAGTLNKLGFVTSKDLSNLGIKDEMVAVYLPHSYNFSGNLFIVPSQNVTPIEGNSAEIMKFIVSGGVSEVPEVSRPEN